MITEVQILQPQTVFTVSYPLMGFILNVNSPQGGLCDFKFLFDDLAAN